MEDGCNPTLIVRWFSHGPHSEVAMYNRYIINGFRFHMKDHENGLCYQNCGVSLVAKTMLVSSVKDKSPIVANMIFYGVVREIWQLDYNIVKVPVLKCDWVKSDTGVKVNDLGFTIVDLQRLGHKDDPFILAAQVKQVFYVQDPKNLKWCCVIENSHDQFVRSTKDGDGRNFGMQFPAKSIPSTDTILSLDDVETYAQEEGERI